MNARLVLCCACVLGWAFGHAAAIAAEPAKTGKSPDPIAGDSVLDAMIRRQTKRQTGEKGTARVRLKRGSAAVRPEDLEPMSDKADAELDAILTRMEAARAKIKSLESELFKRKQVPLFEIDDEFAGVLRFRMPRFLRMELRGPVPRDRRKKPEQRTTITIVNRNYAYIWRKEEREAERFKLPALEEKKFSERNPLEYGLAADIRNLRRDYFLNLRGKETIRGRTTYRLVAGPRPSLKDPRYKRLYFWVDEKTWLTVCFRHVQSDGEVIETYALGKIKLNPSWRDDPFDPPPRSVHVIRHDLAAPKP